MTLNNAPNMLTLRENLDLFVAVDSPVRFKMLLFLRGKEGGTAKHSEIASRLKMTDADEVHHANVLLRTDTVETGSHADKVMECEIKLTPKAQKFLNFLIDQCGFKPIK